MALIKQNSNTMQFGEHGKVKEVINYSSNKKSKRIQVIIDDDLHKEFKIACMKHGVTISDVMTQAIINWLNDKK